MKIIIPFWAESSAIFLFKHNWVGYTDYAWMCKLGFTPVIRRAQKKIDSALITNERY